MYGWILQQLSAASTPELVLGGVILTLVAITSWRINSVITVAFGGEAKQDTRHDRAEKQQKKIIATIMCCPCISKGNATWLQNTDRNGGDPPEPIKCPFLEDKNEKNDTA